MVAGENHLAPELNEKEVIEIGYGPEEKVVRNA